MSPDDLLVLAWPLIDEIALATHARRLETVGIDGAPDALANLFSDRVRLLPLVDDAGLLRAVARPRKQAIQIGRRRIAADAPVYVIAEIGNNHNGSLERARRLVDAAVAAGADSAKFQMRQLRLIYRNGGDPTGSSEDLGVQYTLDLLNRFSLGNDDLPARVLGSLISVLAACSATWSCACPTSIGASAARSSRHSFRASPRAHRLVPRCQVRRACRG